MEYYRSLLVFYGYDKIEASCLIGRYDFCESTLVKGRL